MRFIRLLFAVIMIAVGASSHAADKRFTLVIDAGHGGHDSGAKGSKAYEKNINLSVALAFGRYVERNCPDVRVVYTRKTDVFVPLYERAEIANRNKANLFISVHTNALPGGKVARGFETYTLGDGRSHGKQMNLDVAKRENSVILLEKDYRQHYVGYDPNSPESNIMFEFVQDHNMQQSVAFAKMLQRSVCSMAGRPDKGVHQDNFAVLRLTSMPACLIELGFITTADEERVLTDAASVDKIARGIYNAFAEYKNKQNLGAEIPYKAQSVILPADDSGSGTATRAAYKADDSTPAATADSSRMPLVAEHSGADMAIPTPVASDRPAKSTRGTTRRTTNTPSTHRETSQTRRATQQTRRDTPQPATGDDGIIMFDETGGKGYAHINQAADSTAAAPADTHTARRRAAVKAETRTDSTAMADADSKPQTAGDRQKAADSKPQATSRKPQPEAGTAAKAGVPVFKIQILVASRKLREGDPLLKGLSGCSHYTENGSYKYTYGESANYNEIYRLRKTIIEKFPSCFIIAFKDGNKMDVNAAIREFKQNRNK